MGRACLAALAMVFAVGGCGGGSGSGGSNAPPINSPAPVPSPTPTASPPAQATLSYLHVFGVEPGDGFQPNWPLLQASDGNFYGTTRAGGDNVCKPPDDVPCGTVFRMTPSGAVAVLYSFGASATDGYSPSAPLLQGSDGALYGVTTTGGTYGAGTVFKITLGGIYSVLYSFGASSSDGAVPIGGLIEAADGNFYGVTASGGANHCFQIPQAGSNCGTVFRITPAGIHTALYSFGVTQSDGVTPNGPLIQGADGNFYGTTLNGGANACSTAGETNNCGTAFRITPSGALTVLYSFGISVSDAMGPQGGLIQGSDGAFYGTTAGGGGGTCGYLLGCGTVFRLTPSGQVTIVYAFAPESRADGYGPSSLILGRDGNFYGTTNSGGAVPADLNGTVFRLTPSGVKTILYSFGPVNENPSAPAGLMQGSDGAFYGITGYNGQFGGVGDRPGFGTVFKMTVQ